MKQIHAQLQKCELPSESDIKQLCIKIKEILIDEPNVVHITPPISVCGDIHGQFYDLLELFEVGDYCPESSYLFMGDYVDRGRHSIETILYLFVIKVMYPTKITLLRGNHESRSATRNYGFYSECKRKFGCMEVYNWCMDVFDLLPISAVIGNNFFAVHGGLSPELKGVDGLYGIDRCKEIESEGVISDILWSDPDDDVNDWIESNRGAGFLFGEKQVDQFNQINNFKCVLRSHQPAMNGYNYMFRGKLCTVWSAPNYCYYIGNDASILEIDEHMNKKFVIFADSPDYIPKKDDHIVYEPAYFL